MKLVFADRGVEEAFNSLDEQFELGEFIDDFYEALCVLEHYKDIFNKFHNPDINYLKDHDPYRGFKAEDKVFEFYADQHGYDKVLNIFSNVVKSSQSYNSIDSDFFIKTGMDFVCRMRADLLKKERKLKP